MLRIWYTTSMKKSAAKYDAIFQTLRVEILEGKYSESEKFPSEGMLVRRFAVSRPTVVRALRELKRSGLLQSRAGSGSFLTFAARNATGAIGVIAPDYRKIDFFTDLCDHIASTARAMGYDTLLSDSSAPDVDDRGKWAIEIAHAYAERRTAGVLLEPVDLIPESYEATSKVLAVLAARKIPVVLLDRDYLQPPERSRYDLVGIDNVQAGYRLGLHLVDSGAKNIRFLTQPNYASTIRGRIQGVSQAVVDAGLVWRKDYVFGTAFLESADFRRLMRGRNRPDAFVCRNDQTAAILLQKLSSLKLKVPDDVRIAGFDDAKLAKFLTPPLTTIRQPVKTIASIAVASLLERIRNPDLAPRSILLDAPMVVRASTSSAMRASTK